MQIKNLRLRPDWGLRGLDKEKKLAIIYSGEALRAKEARRKGRAGLDNKARL